MLKSGLRPAFNLTQVLDFEMFTNKIHVCLFDVILIVMKWKLVRVLILLVPILHTYWYLVRFSISHFYVASAPKTIAMFAYKCSTFCHSGV